MKIFVVTGQTATGKTKLAIELSKKHNGELINADSRQIYAHLDIVTGKDLSFFSKPGSPPIHLYSFTDPKLRFSSYEWQTLIKKVISALRKRNKTAVIVGGSYFYIRHLLYGVATDGISADWKLRKVLEQKSVKKLQELLRKTSPEAFEQLNESDKKNPRRLIRRMEIIKKLKAQNSEPKTTTQNSKVLDLKDIRIIGLRFKNRKSLQSAIEQRVQERIRAGAFEEVETLLKIGYTAQDPGLQTIGYQQLISYFQKKLTKKEAVEQWIVKEIQYAKRQYTLMKKDLNIRWIEI